jgi:probable O-glycosylation ligase (exosortase A-associated)
MRATLVLLIVGAGLLLSMRSRFAALLLYLWFALFRPQEWTWGAIDSLRLSLVTGLALIVPALVTGVWPNVTHPLSLGSLALLGTALVAQLAATDPAAGWEALHPLAVSIVVALLMVRLIDTRDRFMTVLMVMAGSIGFYAAKFGVGYLIRGGVPNLDGIGGAFGGNNEVGVAFARALPLMVVVAQFAPRLPITWLAAAAAPLSAVGVISTYSRGSFLALSGAVVAFAALHKRRAVMLSGLAGMGVVALLTVPLPDEYFERLESIGTYERIGEDSALSRLHFWNVALRMAQDYPLGVGLKNYQVNYDQYDFRWGRFGTGRDVHSTHFQALVETGYLGFATYLALVCGAVVFLLRVRSRAAHSALDEGDRRFLLIAANALIASLVAFVVGGTFNSLLINELNWYTFALVAALDRISKQMVETRDVRVKGHVAAA